MEVVRSDRFGVRTPGLAAGATCFMWPQLLMLSTHQFRSPLWERGDSQG